MTKQAKHWSWKLRALGACVDAIEWAMGQPSFAVAWSNCERGDWMLWLMGMTQKRKRVVLAACDCASLSLKHTKDPRVEECINIVRRWAHGKATIEEVKGARRYAAAAAGAAAYAAYALAAAYATTRASTLKQCADIARKHFPNPRLPR